MPSLTPKRNCGWAWKYKPAGDRPRWGWHELLYQCYYVNKLTLLTLLTFRAEQPFRVQAHFHRSGGIRRTRVFLTRDFGIICGMDKIATDTFSFERSRQNGFVYVGKTAILKLLADGSLGSQFFFGKKRR